MVKAVVFDLGRVLVDFDYMIAARRIAAHSKMSPEGLIAVLVRSPVFTQYERGRVTRREVFNEICRASGFTHSRAN